MVSGGSDKNGGAGGSRAPPCRPARNPPGALSSLPRRRARGWSRIPARVGDGSPRARDKRSDAWTTRSAGRLARAIQEATAACRCRRRADRRPGAGSRRCCPAGPAGTCSRTSPATPTASATCWSGRAPVSRRRMYPSRQAREAGIEAGAHRPAAELAADVRQSATAFAAEAARVPAAAWDVPVHGLNGPDHPAVVHAVPAAAGGGDPPRRPRRGIPARRLARGVRRRRAARGSPGSSRAGRTSPPACSSWPAPAWRPSGSARSRGAPRTPVLVRGPAGQPARLADRPGRRRGPAVSGGPDPPAAGGLPPKLPKWS